MTTAQSAASAGSPGKSDARAFREALLASLTAPVADGSGRTGAQAIADRLFTMALAGDGPAIREILDRVDGRPAVAVIEVAAKEPQRIIFGWRDWPPDRREE